MSAGAKPVRCADCIAYQKGGPQLPDLRRGEMGTCHMNPPQLCGVSVNTVEGPKIVPGAGFPEVGAEWWCCRFTPKKKNTPSTN